MGTNKKGLPCKLSPKKGQSYCRHHLVNENRHLVKRLLYPFRLKYYPYKILLVLACSIILMGLLTVIFSIIKGPNYDLNTFTDTQFSDSENYNMTIVLSKNNEENQLKAMLRSIEFDTELDVGNKNSSVETFCIYQLDLSSLFVPPPPITQEADISDRIPRAYSHTISFFPICKKQPDSVVDFLTLENYFGGSKLEEKVKDGELDFFIPINSSDTTYYFPFDERSLRFNVTVYTKVGNSEGYVDNQPIKPRLELDVLVPEWEDSVSFGQSYQTVGLTEPKSLSELDKRLVVTVDMVFKRPFALRVLTLVLLSSILCFIILSIFVRETSSFLEISVGLLFGLWGIRTALVPSYITTTTMIDTLILALYAFFAYVVFIRFVIKPFWVRLSRNK